MPASEVVVSFGTSVIALFGGGGVVLVAICGFVSKFIADRAIEGHKAGLNAELERVKSELAKQSELHKLKIRKAEILFDRELQAVSDFGVLYRQISPEYSRPDMEWEDACEIVAGRFTAIEKQLQDYLTKHSPVLTEHLREQIKHCVTYASHNKFGAYDAPEDEASAAERTAAGNLLEELSNVEIGLLQLVKNETRG